MVWYISQPLSQVICLFCLHPKYTGKVPCFQVASKLPRYRIIHSLWSLFFRKSNFPSWNDFPKFLFTMGELIFWKVGPLREGSTFPKPTWLPQGSDTGNRTWSKSQIGVNFSRSTFPVYFGCKLSLVKSPSLQTRPHWSSTNLSLTRNQKWMSTYWKNL